MLPEAAIAQNDLPYLVSLLYTNSQQGISATSKRYQEEEEGVEHQSTTVSMKRLPIYARRWHIENKLSDIVHFFNVNALSSPIMIRIHFDLLWTIIADTLYLLLAKDLRRFENCSPQKLFKQFIDMPGQIDYDGKRFTVRIRKRATTQFSWVLIS